jgi:hypothetical protein
MAQTSIGTADENVVHITSRLKIGADEIMHGETVVEGSGEFAQIMRRFVMQSEGKSAQVALDALGKRLNIIGEYGLAMPPAMSRPEPYRIRTTWTSEKPVELLAKGMRIPPGLTPISANVSLLFGPLTRNRVYSAMCQPGQIVQEVSIELHDGIALKDLPKPVHASTANFEFKRDWSQREQMIVEHSELQSTVNSSVCTPDTITAVADAFDEIRNSVDPILRFERPAASIP